MNVRAKTAFDRRRRGQAFGELPAVLLELPIMLAISWFVCTKLIDRNLYLPL